MGTLIVFALCLAGVPAVMVCVNLFLYRRPAAIGEEEARRFVSVLIPARNEEASIGRAVDSVLSSHGVEVEVIVMDDGSDDRTAQIVRRIAERDERVRLETAPPLPQGWCGKQHACFALARASRHPILLFLDADVRLAPDGIAVMLAHLDRSGADLISGIPRQRTDTWAEKLVVPLVHFVLLGFLPLWRMRRSRRPAYAAGCGQLFLARRGAYFRADGHRAIRGSRHDGITLPRAFRRAGSFTDLFDATDVATCRMYRNAAEVWRGFAKNASEGMATPVAILPWSLVLFGGQVLPLPLVFSSWLAGMGRSAMLLAGVALAVSYFPRVLLGLRFRQSRLGTWLHPLGVMFVLAIQWYALAQQWLGRGVSWKGRAAVGP